MHSAQELRFSCKPFALWFICVLVWLTCRRSLNVQNRNMRNTWSSDLVVDRFRSFHTKSRMFARIWARGLVSAPIQFQLPSSHVNWTFASIGPSRPIGALSMTAAHSVDLIHTAACHHNGWVENCSWIVFAMSIMHILGNFEADTPPSQHFAGSLTVCVVARWVWLKIVHLFTKLDGWIITTNSQQNFKRMTKGRTTRDPPNDWKNDRRNDQRRGQFGGSIPRRFLPFPVVPLFRWAIWPLDDSQGAVPQMSSMSSSRLPPLSLRRRG